MPIAAPIIAAGITAASQGANMAAQGKMNLRTRQFAEEMYFRQRADALTDWDTQNKYNSPAEQMKRYTDAGLNPNLIYGQSNNSEAVRSTPMQSWNPKAPQFDAGAVTGAYFNTKMQLAQQDQLEKQRQLMDEEIKLKRAQTIFQNVQSAGGTLDNTLKNTLMDSSIQAAQLNNEGRRADIQKTYQTMGLDLTKMDLEIIRNEREASTAVEQILKSKVERANIAQQTTNSKEQEDKIRLEKEQLMETIRNLKTEGRLKLLDEELKQEGLQPGDALWQRKITKFLSEITGLGTNKAREQERKIDSAQPYPKH